PSISADGKHVTFVSNASNLDTSSPNDSDNARAYYDVYVYDMADASHPAQTTRISGLQGNLIDPGFLIYYSAEPDISADGSVITFYSWVNDFAPWEDVVMFDTFVYDRSSGQSTLINVDFRDQSVGGGFDLSSSISDDGRYIAFQNFDDNLNSVADVLSGQR